MSIKNCDFGYIKKKRMFKLSLIVDSNRISLSTVINEGSISDQKIFIDNLDNILTEH